MKKITLFCAAVAAAMGMNAQETALTADMWHQWTGWGADATIIEGAETGCDYNVGKELAQSDMVIGPASCNGDLYADLTEYAGIEGVATPGVTMRFYLNRQELQGPGADIKVNTDADGKFTFNFSELGSVEYVHLNFIKIAAVWQGGQWPEGLEKCVVESVNLIPKTGEEQPDDPIVPADQYAINGSWFHQWDGYGADAAVIAEAVEGIEDQLGKEVGGGATVLGTGSVWGDIYVDLTEYEGIEAEGTPGVGLRLLFNRPTQDAGITECYAQFDADGKFTFMFTDVKDGAVPASFIHLNAVKTPWVLPEGISACKVTKFNAIPKGGSSAVNAIEKADSSVIYNIYG